MKRFFAVLVFAAGVLVAGGASAEDMSGNVQFLVGQRYMSDYWKPLDRPTMFGVIVDFAPESSPVRVALGGQFSWDSQSTSIPVFGKTGDVAAGTFEFSAGFVWLPVKKAPVRPYIGAGAVLITAAAGSDWGDFGSGDTDTSFGFYGNAGIYFKVGDTFNIGLDGRIVRGTTIQLGPTEGNANYEQLSLLLGFSFGK